METQTLTTYMSANKLIDKMPEFFPSFFSGTEAEKIAEAKHVFLYFDKMYENEFGGSTNILKMCLVGAKNEIL